MLLKAGAKPGLMDMEGKNALDYAESAEFDDVVAMLSACDDGPSICSTFRGTGESSSASAEPMVSQRGLAPPGATSARAGGAQTPRMTPRVPLAGEVSSRLTPRAPGNSGAGGGGGGSGRSSSRTTHPTAYRGGNGRVYEINPTTMGALERDKMLYLAKKLVHLSILLEQDTVTDDHQYPSFHAPPSGLPHVQSL